MKKSETTFVFSSFWAWVESIFLLLGKQSNTMDFKDTSTISHMHIYIGATIWEFGKYLFFFSSLSFSSSFSIFLPFWHTKCMLNYLDIYVWKSVFHQCERHFGNMLAKSLGYFVSRLPRSLSLYLQKKKLHSEFNINVCERALPFSYEMHTQCECCVKYSEYGPQIHIFRIFKCFHFGFFSCHYIDVKNSMTLLLLPLWLLLLRLQLSKNLDNLYFPQNFIYTHQMNL